MQTNILAQGVQTLTWSDGQAGSTQGRFVELFAGEGTVTQQIQALGREGESYEAFPACQDDSGLGATTYLEQYDLCHPPTLLALLEDIYSGKVSAAHLGTPCHTWGIL